MILIKKLFYGLLGLGLLSQGYAMEFDNEQNNNRKADTALDCSSERIYRLNNEIETENSSSTGNKNYFENLSPEMQEFILHYLSPKDCICFMFTCREFIFIGQRRDKTLPYGFDLFKGSLILFPNLTELNLRQNDTITDGVLSVLTNLTNLNIAYNKTITDGGLSGLTNLTNLNLFGNETITDGGLSGLTNLTNLDL
jgi:hypothetical protein